MLLLDTRLRTHDLLKITQFTRFQCGMDIFCVFDEAVG